MMYMTDYQLRLIHEDRLREATRLRAQRDLIRDATEPMANEFQGSLLQQIKQLVHVENRQPQQDSTDVRHAHAL